MKFSIITPSFNQGRFLERTIKSVLGQRGVSIEYIVLDGGSTDESVSIIKRYQDKLAYWVSEPDGGQTAAINEGLKLVTGDIVAYINSDDFYAPDAFMTVYNIFRDPSVNWIAGRVQVVDENGNKLYQQVPVVCEGLVESLAWGVTIGQPGVFLRKSLFDNYGLFDEKFSYIFDTEYWIRLLYNGERPQLVEEVLAYRCLHGGTKTECEPEKFDAERDLMIQVYSGRLSEEEQDHLKDAKLSSEIHRNLNLASSALKSKQLIRAALIAVESFYRAPSVAARDIAKRIQNRAAGFL